MANQIPYGFFDLRDVFPEPVANVDMPTINEAVQVSLQEHNRQVDSLLNLFVERTTEKQVQFKSPYAARLQPTDEFGRARPIKGISKYTVAFPLLSAAAGFGETYEASIKMTVEDVSNRIAMLQEADLRWVRDHLLAALFLAEPYTHTNEEDGDLTIECLADGDATVYQLISGADTGATDTHLLAQAAAISDEADPFDGIVEELNEHPENGGDAGDVIVLIPKNAATATKGLSGFYQMSDPNIRVGSATAELVGSIGQSVPGKIVGYHEGGCWIAEWAGLPDNYLLAVKTVGDRPLRMREEPLPQLRGFRQEARREDYPYYEAIYKRTAGFGVYNRVGAVAYRIGNASYAVPSGYESIMA